MTSSLTQAQWEATLPTPLTMTFSWGETPCDALIGRLNGNDALPAVAVGRLPVTATSELDAIVSKILAYANLPDGQTFESTGVFVTGEPKPDEESAIFTRAIDDGIDYLPTGFSVARVDATSYAGPADTRAAIISAINSGALLVNYHGHGSREYWSDNQIFREVDVPSLTNTNALPIVLGMTCLDSFYASAILDDSLAESLIKYPTGGAVAVFGAAGTASVAEKGILNRALFEALFGKGDRRLGDAYLEASRTFLANNSDIENVLHAHVILGDPSMNVRLPFPDGPQNVTVQWLGGLQVSISWSINDEDDLAGYCLLRSNSPGGPYVEVAGSALLGKASTYVDTVPTYGSYYYVVRAEDATGFQSPIVSESAIEVQAPAGGGGGGGGGCLVSQIPTSPLGFLFSLFPLGLLLLRKVRRWPTINNTWNKNAKA